MAGEILISLPVLLKPVLSHRILQHIPFSNPSCQCNRQIRQLSRAQKWSCHFAARKKVKKICGVFYSGGAGYREIPSNPRTGFARADAGTHPIVGTFNMQARGCLAKLVKPRHPDTQTIIFHIRIRVLPRKDFIPLPSSKNIEELRRTSKRIEVARKTRANELRNRKENEGYLRKTKKNQTKATSKTFKQRAKWVFGMSGDVSENLLHVRQWFLAQTGVAPKKTYNTHRMPLDCVFFAVHSDGQFFHEVSRSFTRFREDSRSLIKAEGDSYGQVGNQWRPGGDEVTHRQGHAYPQGRPRTQVSPEVLRLGRLGRPARKR